MTSRSSTRRAVLLAAVTWPALACTSVVLAQSPARVRRIGFLSQFSPTDSTSFHEVFRLGLRDRGWIEGKNVRIEYRYAEGRNDRLPDLAADLVRVQVDVIAASTAPAALAAQKATKTIPIVVVAAGDPVAVGLVESLARPGGNITGLSQMAPELAGKRLEMLTEVVPKLSRVAVLWNPQSVASSLAWKAIHDPARKLGVELDSLEVRSPSDFDQAFESATKRRAGALFLMSDPVIGTNLKRIAAHAAKNRLPSIFQWSEFADLGGLMTYGPDRGDMYRRAANFVDKILKGAKPAELPVEQPTKFELVVNMKTAKALGIKIPQTILIRADRVIE